MCLLVNKTENITSNTLARQLGFPTPTFSVIQDEEAFHIIEHQQIVGRRTFSTIIYLNQYFLKGKTPLTTFEMN